MSKDKDKVILIANMRSRPKERPGYNFNQRRAYTKKNTSKFESDLKDMCQSMMIEKGKKPFEKGIPLKMQVFIYLEAPKSWKKKDKQDAIDGKIYPTGMNIGDLDNHLKSILDGCNRVVYEDDSSIVSMSAQMRYSDSDKIIIIVEEE